MINQPSKMIDEVRLPRRAVLTGIAAVSAAMPAMVQAQGQASAWGPEEIRAMALVREWAAALLAKDIPRFMALMDPDIQYRDDPFQTELKKGQELLLKDIEILLRGLNGMTIETIYAIGSSKDDVLVLARRKDEFVLGRNQVSVLIGAYYRIRQGKILEWLDTPLVDLPPPPSRAG